MKMARTKQTARKSTTMIKPTARKSTFGPLVTVKTRGKSIKDLKKPKLKKRVHHYRPGELALKEIRQYQKSTKLLMRRAPF